MAYENQAKVDLYGAGYQKVITKTSAKGMAR
jgi:hypothetical protein